MSILSRLTYSLEVILNIFVKAFEFERRIEDSKLQIDALLETLFYEDENSNPHCYRVFD